MLALFLAHCWKYFRNKVELPWVTNQEVLPTQWLRPAEPSCRFWRHVINSNLKEPSPLPYTVGCSHHGITLFTSHCQTVVRDLQLRCCNNKDWSRSSLKKKKKNPTKPELLIFLKNAFIYLCHVRPAALSHRGRPCTGHQEWASQPSSPVPASLGPEREDLVLPGCNGSRLCWRDAREDNHEEASAGQKTGGHYDKRGETSIRLYIKFKGFKTESLRIFYTILI